jgi:hypothetical protein
VSDFIFHYVRSCVVANSIEEKVLSAWHRLISGAEFGEEALKHASTLLKVVSRTP